MTQLLATNLSISQGNNKRIAKNTLMLYIRMLLTMAVSLYTSRVVLNTLGVEDFGIYSVVAGVVIMFSFLSGAMASTTQRFLSVELGKNNLLQLKKVFSISLNIYFIIALIIVILAETLGLWFLNSSLSIPPQRFEAAHWAYQFAIISFSISVVQVPYNASIIAHEKMGIYAYLSVAEVILKLAIVYLLLIVTYDKLKLYSLLMCCITFLIFIFYRLYCKKSFVECTYHHYKDLKLFQELLNFSGWSLFGSLAWVTTGQGMNMILNIFFGPVVNASRAIAYQVSGIVSAFINNFRLAVNPQIIKSNASGNLDYRSKLVFESAKYSFFLLLLLTLPILLETNLILHAWLKIVPKHTVYFCQLILINTLIQCCDIGIVFTAIGRIKENQFWGGLIYLLTLPISYFLLKSQYPPESVFYVQIIATLIVIFGINIILLKKIAFIHPTVYIHKLIIPVIKVTLVAVICPIIIRLIMVESFYRFVIITTCSSVSILLSIYYLGLDTTLKLTVIRLLNNKFKTFIGK